MQRESIGKFRILEAIHIEIPLPCQAQLDCPAVHRLKFYRVRLQFISEIEPWAKFLSQVFREAVEWGREEGEGSSKSTNRRRRNTSLGIERAVVGVKLNFRKVFPGNSTPPNFI